MKPGGWANFRALTEEEKAIFSKALEKFEGVNYTPIAVATQVLSGINYKFFCNSQVIYPNAPNKTAMVTIYVPVDGPIHVTEIKPIDA